MSALSRLFVIGQALSLAPLNPVRLGSIFLNEVEKSGRSCLLDFYAPITESQPKGDFVQISRLILAAVLVSTAMPALAQQRIIIRRPLSSTPPAAVAGATTAPAPAATCQYFHPYWNIAATPASVCVGSTAPANANCMAYTDSTRSSAAVAVDDSVCLEDSASYYARCGN